jgi:hypothetical protein
MWLDTVKQEKQNLCDGKISLFVLQKLFTNHHEFP